MTYIRRASVTRAHVVKNDNGCEAAKKRTETLNAAKRQDARGSKFHGTVACYGCKANMYASVTID